EQLEITFNKTKYDALPAKLKAIIASAVDAASANMMWKAIDRNSQDYITLQSVDKVKFYKTPPSILQRQLELYDQVIAKKSEGNPLFQEIVASQKKFAERAVKWEQDVVVSRGMAYAHYFGKGAAPAAAAPKKA
ncbi:MAG: C4-dicarboxylate ABC transporter, partial [Usitatibacter sp.]